MKELTDEEKLILEYKKGSEKALESIVRANKDLICSIYQKYFSFSGCPKEDLCQEGNIGLMEAIKRYDPDKSGGFKTYKFVRIRKQMFDFRRRFFRFPTETLGPEHNLIEYEPPSSEKCRNLAFELDNLVSCGKMPLDKAKNLIGKIVKGTK